MLVIAFALSLVPLGVNQDSGIDPFLGRWDIMILDSGTTFNSCWWKVEKKDEKLVAQMVWRWGSVVPAEGVEISGGEIRMTRGKGKKKLLYRGKIKNGELHGTVEDGNGKVFQFRGKRAPELSASAKRKWGEPISLIDGDTLEGWKLRKPDAKLGWEVKDGVLMNARPGNDIVSEMEFMDFKLHLEFNVAAHSNSGIYLRGRYEVQILDDHGKRVQPHGCGAVYSRLAPDKNVSKKAGEWQTCDITLVGRELTVSLNGQTVIDRGYLDGITGGALLADESKPGPLMLQGDHGKVSFRNILVTPLEP